MELRRGVFRYLVPDVTVNGSVALTGGQLAGAGTLTINGVMTWTAGSLTGSGMTVFGAGSVGNITNYKPNPRAVINRAGDNFGTGYINWGGSPLKAGAWAVVNKPN